MSKKPKTKDQANNKATQGTANNKLHSGKTVNAGNAEMSASINEPVGLMDKLVSFNSLRDLVFIILLGVIVVSPYYRGLFFREDAYNFQLYVTIILAVLLVVLWVEKVVNLRRGISVGSNQGLLTNRPIDFLIWGLPTVYLLSTLFTAVDAGLSRDILLRNVSYATVYSILIMTIRTRRHQYLVLNAIVLSAIWVSIYGIGNIFGKWEFGDAVLGLRLSSVFQYPNTLAAFTGGVFFLAIVMAMRPYKNYIFSSTMTGIYTAIAALMVGTFLLTGSRAALVALAMTFVLGLIFVPLRDKLSYLVLSGIGTVAGVYIMTKVTPLIRAFYDYNRKPDDFPPIEAHWEIIFTAMGLAFLAGLVYGLIHHLGQHSRKLLLASQGLILVLLVIGFIVLVPVATDFLADNEDLFATTLKRIETIINAEEQSSYTARNVFVQDGIRIYKDYPILGAGGGAWEVLFESYQEYSYWSTQAHIYYVQLMTEVGTLGLLVLAGILLAFVSCLAYLYLHNQRTGQREHNYLLLAVFLLLMMMLGHSAADFDMSYSFFAVVVWMGFALVFAGVNFTSSGSFSGQEDLQGQSIISKKHNKNKNMDIKDSEARIEDDGETANSGIIDKLYILLSKVMNILTRPLVTLTPKLTIMSVVALVLIVANSMPIMAEKNIDKASQVMQESEDGIDFDRMFELYEKAYKQDKLDYRLVAKYSHFMSSYSQLVGDETEKAKVEREAIEALRTLSVARPENVRLGQELVNSFSRNGYGHNAKEELNRLADLSPYNRDFHSGIIIIEYNTLEQDLANADIDEARVHLQSLLDTHERFLEAKAANDENRPENYKTTINLTNAAAHKMGIAYYLAGDYDQAVTLLKQGVRDADDKEDATCWLAAAYFQAGVIDEFQETLIKAAEMNEENIEFIESLLEIEPIL